MPSYMRPGNRGMAVATESFDYKREMPPIARTPVPWPRDIFEFEKGKGMARPEDWALPSGSGPPPNWICIVSVAIPARGEGE